MKAPSGKLSSFSSWSIWHDYESEDIISLLREMFEFVCHFEGEIPGAAPEACGNYLDQNLPMAKYLAEKYLEHVLTGITPDRLKY